MLKILQGDDTAANKRSITISFPGVYPGPGYTAVWEFCGIVKTAALTEGGSMTIDYTRDQTSAFPLGVVYGKFSIKKDGLQETVGNIPVLVTDSPERAYGYDNSVNIAVRINVPIPHIDKTALTKGSSVGDIKALANAILDAINQTSEE